MQEQRLCKLCGSPIEFWREDEDTCFSCDLWTIRQTEVSLPETVIAEDGNGGRTFYSIGDENCKSPFRGFGGAHVTIHFFDGRVVKSSNLWCGGDIPERFYDKYPINASIEWKWDTDK